MFAMKDEVLPILARVSGVSIKANVLNIVTWELDTACRACDGSPDTVDAVRKAADAVQSAAEECFDLAESAANCARRCCDRLT